MISVESGPVSDGRRARFTTMLQLRPLRAILWLVLAMFASPVLAQDFIDRVIAVVDNVPLTLSEYRLRHRQEVIDGGRLKPFDGTISRPLLDRMIDERVQVQQAERRGISVSEQEVESTIEFIARQNNLSPGALLTQLASDGITADEFRGSIRERQMIRKLVDAIANSRVVVSEQEIENYLNAHDELRSDDESYELSHFFVLTKDKPEQQIAAERENVALIRQRIEGGLPFEQAVRELSDSSSREDGGYLGWRTPDQLPELFLNALRKLSPDEQPLSEVIESENGLHLLKLHDRKGSGNLVQQQLIQHILIKPDADNTLAEAEEKANRIYNQLLAGESFEKMVRLFSMDAQSRANGGSLGWMNPGALVEEFESAANALPLGRISPPVRTRYGFHIIRVMDRRNADMTSEIAINTARQAIFRRKAEELYGNWFQSIRERAFVEYVDPQVAADS